MYREWSGKGERIMSKASRAAAACMNYLRSTYAWNFEDGCGLCGFLPGTKIKKISFSSKVKFWEFWRLLCGAWGRFGMRSDFDEGRIIDRRINYIKGAVDDIKHALYARDWAKTAVCQSTSRLELREQRVNVQKTNCLVFF